MFPLCRGKQLRKAQAMEQQRQEAAAEVAAENDNSIEAERHAIGSQCRKLHLHIKEIEPDGHWYAGPWLSFV